MIPVSTSTGFRSRRYGLNFHCLKASVMSFCLIGKCAEKVNVFYLAFFIDDDSNRNRIEPVLGENRINPRNHVLVPRIILNAHWDIAATRPRRGVGFRGQLHLVEVEHQALQQLRILAG